ncbi:MAG: hypothetical protein RM049_20825 [Nostoc sp. DedQUE04]|uniref:hypothetical protein n=1 Tax=Nostoc sp. DedQUE04 TaxID=3075390 RepID=UPI002AD328A7|nr:hypothetical protein [Nostoc sp. DedQUE04]MDZ8137716.1 hypothetical protein [Nostoc sp. DedQUE04]
MSNSRVAKIIRPRIARTRLSRNVQQYQDFVNDGYNYILNPESGELHLVGLSNFRGPHNLTYANLEEFWGIYNLDDDSPIDHCLDGTEIPLYWHDTNEFIGNYTLNKCKHCFPV